MLANQDKVLLILLKLNNIYIYLCCDAEVSIEIERREGDLILGHMGEEGTAKGRCPTNTKIKNPDLKDQTI